MAVWEIYTQAAIEAHLGRGAARHAVGPKKDKADQLIA